MTDSEDSRIIYVHEWSDTTPPLMTVVAKSFNTKQRLTVPHFVDATDAVRECERINKDIQEQARAAYSKAADAATAISVFLEDEVIHMDPGHPQFIAKGARLWALVSQRRFPALLIVIPVVALSNSVILFTPGHPPEISVDYSMSAEFANFALTRTSAVGIDVFTSREDAAAALKIRNDDSLTTELIHLTATQRRYDEMVEQANTVAHDAINKDWK